MGLFGQSSSCDGDIEKATCETNTNENWSLILDVCDKISTNPRNTKDYLKAILKRIGHNDPHASMQAVTLLDACVNNCGKPFHLEIASRDFETEYQRLLSKVQPKVSLKMRKVLKKWAENEFSEDPELKLIPSFYKKLMSQGIEFNNLDDEPEKTAVRTAPPKDPNVVTSQQEEDDIAKAIELSLKEAKSSPRHQASSNSSGSGTTYPSLYPSFSGGISGGSNTSPTAAGDAANASQQPEPRKVRALYDFEAAEENELTFFSGEIIHVLDDSDANWWKGFNQRGEGLFPSNFVTADLSVDPKRLEINQQNNNQKNDNESAESQQQEKTDANAGGNISNQRIEIDEGKIHRLLHLLHEANPEDPSQDSEEMLRLEQEVHRMGPLIDTELERVDRKHAQLTQLSSDLVDAINLYHSLMRDDRNAAAALNSSLSGGALSYMPPPGMLPGMHMPGSMAAAAPNSLGYPSSMTNQHIMYGNAGYAGAVGSIAGGNFPHQMPQQSFGMTSLPYVGNAAVPNMPTTIAAPVIHSSPMANAQIPMQFQNGHVNSTQMNGNGIPNQQHQQPTAGYQMLAQQPQQFQQTSAMPLGTVAGNEMQQQQQSTAPPQTPLMQQQQPTFMSPQHQIQQATQQLPYMAVPHQFTNGQHPQMIYNMPPTSTNAANAVNGILQQMPAQVLAQHAAAANANQLDQFSQMQHQMAAMSLGMGGSGGGVAVNQQLAQNFLPNEPKQNIPT